MSESALERYFENFVENDSPEMEKSDEEFLRLLPEELLSLSNDATGSGSLDYSSQNATAGVSSMPEDRPTTLGTQQQKLVPRIRNVICTVVLGCPLDLNLIARNAWNVEYNPQVYKALIMRLREPRTTAMIYSSGNLVCLGAKSVAQARLAARRFARILQKLGFPVRFLDFKIRNIVASCDSFRVSLEQLALHEHCSYEAELFPGLIYRGVPNISIAIFISGKMTFVGATSEAKIYEALEAIQPILSLVRRNQSETSSR